MSDEASLSLAASGATNTSPSNFISRLPTGRVDVDKLRSDEHWGISVAEEVIKAFPHQDVYTCAAGISPSGVVHFGNLRDVMTSLAVARGLQILGKRSRLLFSWDDFDRFRKVPAGIPESFAQYLGRPLGRVPSPISGFESYARYFEASFEKSMVTLGIEVDWRYQSKEYPTGRYFPGLKQALHKRKDIAEVLLGNMSEKGIKEKGIDREAFMREYYPLSIYSEVSGTDDTTVLSYDGEATIEYRCNRSGKTCSLDLRTSSLVKLPWKIDWPMRWSAEEVNFEPGGRDHASPNGSFDSAGVIAEVVYGRRPPVFIGYEFIGLQGLAGKMSGSKGGALTPDELMRVYEPEVLTWLYMRKPPQSAFNIAFDSEVYRVYDEFDREVAAVHSKTLDSTRTRAIEFSVSGAVLPEKRMSFRQIVGLGQIVQWDVKKLLAVAQQSGVQESEALLKSRLERARFWLSTYQPEAAITVRNTPNQEIHAALNEAQRVYVSRFRTFLAESPDATVEEIEKVVYQIPKNPELTEKENKVLQREFFVTLYQLLISVDTGPRLPTFVWALDRERVLSLLSQET